ncbi:UNVERIFIED_CONTAM: hypothetical protein HDU68_011275 [Siphonaria sp. JEL0065]|nr:hypothetical protein HDU68_011275 [Siphonaria sp. JEL0065]
MSLIQVTQAANGGAVTATLFLSNYYLEGFNGVDLTITTSFSYAGTTLCSTSAPAVANVGCPSGLTAASCVAVSCAGSAPPAPVTTYFVAPFVVCPKADPACANTGAQALSSAVNLSAPSSFRGAPLPPPPPPAPVVPAPAPAPVNPPAAASEDVPNPADPAPTNGSGSQANSANDSSSSSSNNSSNPLVVVPSSTSGNGSGSSSTGQNNQSRPGNNPIPAATASGSPIAFIAAGLVSVVAVMGAVALLVRRRSQNAQREREEIIAQKRMSPEYPFGKPITRASSDEVEEMRVQFGVPPPPKSPLPLPSLDRINSHHLNKSIDPILAAKSYDLNAQPMKFRSMSMERPAKTASLASPTSPSSTKSAAAIQHEIYRANTLERAKHTRNASSSIAVSASSISSSSSSSASLSRASSSSQDDVYPGYYDANGVYHFFTPEQLKEQQLKQRIGK